MTPPRDEPRYRVVCDCGWTTEDLPDRPAAVRWRRWHLYQVTPKGSRTTESGHRATVLRSPRPVAPAGD